MVQNKTKMIARSALMMALVCVATFSIKIPNPVTGGYSHMGDCMIFLGVLILGKKQGALASGLGAALSDLLSGAAIWIVPTFVIKYVMGWLMGYIVEKQVFSVGNHYLAAILAGIFQCIGYTLVKIPMFGVVAAVGSIFGICMQTLAGLVIFFVLHAALSKTPFLNYTRKEVL